MTRLSFNDVSSFGSANPITFSSGSITTGTWSTAPAFPTITSPDYAVIIVEPDTPNEEITYLTAYTAGQTSGTFTRAAETSTGGRPAGSGIVHSATSWVHGPTAIDFPLSTRLSTSRLTATSLAPNATEQSTLTMAKSYRLLSCAVSVPARVRLYDRAAKQTADLSRSIGTLPQGDHGVVYEFVGASGLLSSMVQPPAVGASDEVTPSSSVPLTIDNLSGLTQQITATLAYMVLEP